MSIRGKTLDTIRTILIDRSFNEAQIKKIIPSLGPGYAKEPHLLSDVIDCWNIIMRTAKRRTDSDNMQDHRLIPAVAAPSSASLTAKYKVNMNTILADVEPKLLQFKPDNLIRRHEQVQGLGVIKNMNEQWIALYNAPRGFYLQEWSDLTKKVMYVTNNLLDLLYEKKEMKEMQTHPLVKSAAIVEKDFDHIRTRYLFASRVGFKELSQMYKVSTAKSKLTLSDLVLANNNTFLRNFAPHCTTEEYNCFAMLINQHDIDEDDADIYEDLAELESLKYEAWPHKLRKKDLREAIARQRERKSDAQ